MLNGFLVGSGLLVSYGFLSFRGSLTQRGFLPKIDSLADYGFLVDVGSEIIPLCPRISPAYGPGTGNPLASLPLNQ